MEYIKEKLFLKSSHNRRETDAELSEEINIALSRETERKRKIQLLTNVPSHWNARRIQKNLGVFYRLAFGAKKMRLSYGYGSYFMQRKLIATYPKILFKK